MARTSSSWSEVTAQISARSRIEATRVACCTPSLYSSRSARSSACAGESGRRQHVEEGLILAQAEGALRHHDEHAPVFDRERPTLDGLVGLVEVAVHRVGSNGHDDLVAPVDLEDELLVGHRDSLPERVVQGACRSEADAVVFVEDQLDGVDLFAGDADGERLLQVLVDRVAGQHQQLGASLHGKLVVGPHGLVPGQSREQRLPPAGVTGEVVRLHRVDGEDAPRAGQEPVHLDLGTAAGPADGDETALVFGVVRGDPGGVSPGEVGAEEVVELFAGSAPRCVPVATTKARSLPEARSHSSRSARSTPRTSAEGVGRVASFTTTKRGDAAPARNSLKAEPGRAMAVRSIASGSSALPTFAPSTPATRRASTSTGTVPLPHGTSIRMLRLLSGRATVAARSSCRFHLSFESLAQTSTPGQDIRRRRGGAGGLGEPPAPPPDPGFFR